VNTGGHGRAVRPPRLAARRSDHPQRRDRFQGHVSAALNRPFVILFEQQGADEALDGVFVGEDAHDVGAPLDFAIETFERIDGVDFRPMIFREAHEGQHIGLCFVHERGALRHFGTQLIGDLSPLRPGRFGVVLDEGRADEGRPSLLTPTATMIATESMRPFSRTFT
jgi:hypothetical protein